MENNKMGLQKSSSIKKPMRRRCHSRRLLPPDCIINMAEARREIVHALHLHRSSSSTSSSSSSTVAAPGYNNYYISNPKIATPSSSSSQSQCCYYSLTESMPIPEPIWSTTAPSVIAAPAPVPVTGMESVEFEWGGDNEASASYSWWLGFLNSLDGKKKKNINVDQNYSKIAMGREVDSVQQQVDGSDQNAICLDEWLMFPTIDDEGETAN